MRDLTTPPFSDLHVPVEPHEPPANSGREGASRDPLHGKTLEAILQHLVESQGWAELGRRIEIRCFNHQPSIKSSLQFLRRTPWARAKVEALYREIIGLR